MSGKIIELILILVGSAFKYSITTLFAADSSLGTLTAYIANILGGVWGIVCFTFLGKSIQIWFKKRQIQSGKYRVFTKRNRYLVKFRNGLGLAGIAFLTPILLTIPLGILLSLSLSQDRNKIILFHFLSCVFWTSIILLPYKLLNIDISRWFMNLF